MHVSSVAVLIAVTVAILSGGRTADLERDHARTFGHSVRGQALEARRWGDASSRRTVLVVGSIHGDETEGHRILRELTSRRGHGLDGVDLWTVKTLNPDGVAAGTRGNAHAVDLNRNFAHDWRPIPPSSGYYSGPAALSEPETRAARRLIRRIRPRLTVWYHQPWGETLIPCGEPGREVALRYARLAGLPARDCFPSPPGSATGWQREGLGASAFVVELPAGRLGSAELRRHARALIEIAGSCSTCRRSTRS